MFGMEEAAQYVAQVRSVGVSNNTMEQFNPYKDLYGNRSYDKRRTRKK